MNPTLPIIKAEMDLFGRKDYSIQLARQLLLRPGSPSIVFGLEAEWGAGKTSVFNMVKEDLQKSKHKPIVVDYDPWLLGTLESLVEGFFVQLASEIGIQDSGGKAKQLAVKIASFSKLLSPMKLIPGAEPWGSLLENMIDALGSSSEAADAAGDLLAVNLHKRLLQIQTAIDELGKPIVVFVDDVDRLPPEGIRTLFQLLKTVGNLNQVSYLVAYDPGTVEGVLSYEKVFKGREYLEKIVQVAFPIPRMSVMGRRKLLERALQDLRGEVGFQNDDGEPRWFDTDIIVPAVLQSLRTPRSIHRICNRLRLLAPQVGSECFLEDLFLFELLSECYPKVVQLIRISPEIFVLDEDPDDEFPYVLPREDLLINERAERKEDRQNFKLKMDQILDMEDLKEYKSDTKLYTILDLLFPHLVCHPDQNVIIRARSLSRRNNLLKVLHCGLTEHTYSVQDCEAFLLKVEMREAIWDEQLNNGVSFLQFYQRLEISMLEVGIQDPEGFYRFVLERIKENRVSGHIKDLEGNLYSLINTWLLDPGQRGNYGNFDPAAFMKWVITETEDLYFSGVLVTNMLHRCSLMDNHFFVPKEYDTPDNQSRWDAKHAISFEQIKELRQLWLRKVADAESHKFCTDHSYMKSTWNLWFSVLGSDPTYTDSGIIEKGFESATTLKFAAEYYMKLSRLNPPVADIPSLIEKLKNELPGDANAQKWALKLEGIPD